MSSELAYEYEVRSPDAPYFGHDFNDGWRRNTEESAIYLRDERGYEVRRRQVTAWEAVVAEPQCDCRYGYQPQYAKHEPTCAWGQWQLVQEVKAGGRFPKEVGR